MSYFIHIDDLELIMSIGILRAEKQRPQRVLIDVALEVNRIKNWQEDNIENVLNYKDVIDAITALARAKHFNLLETLAEEIVQLCLTYDVVQEASVAVHKPDILPGEVSVGVEITRARTVH